MAAEDGDHSVIEPGAYATNEDWEQTLETILQYHEDESPIPHVRKFELVKGDVSRTVPHYLEQHPETIVALAYFDMDLYQPTRDALAAIRPYLTRGSVLGFDEACLASLPGETVAIREVLGLDRIRLRRTPYCPVSAFAIWAGD